MQRYKQLPIIRYGSKKSMIKKDKKHVSKSTLLKSKIQASANARFGLNKKISNSSTLDHYNRQSGSSRQEFKNQRIKNIFISSSTWHHHTARNKAYRLIQLREGISIISLRIR